MTLGCGGSEGVAPSRVGGSRESAVLVPSSALSAPVAVSSAPSVAVATSSSAEVAQDDPTKDSDGDGVPDVDDACPHVPGPKYQDGCPSVCGEGASPALVVIALFPRFDVASATLVPRDNAVDKIVEALRAHPELEVSRIVGHTDDYEVEPNSLGKKRAAAVSAYLAKAGIDVSHAAIESVGAREPIFISEHPNERMSNRLVQVHVRLRAVSPSR